MFGFAQPLQPRLGSIAGNFRPQPMLPVTAPRPQDFMTGQPPGAPPQAAAPQAAPAAPTAPAGDAASGASPDGSQTADIAQLLAAFFGG